MYKWAGPEEPVWPKLTVLQWLAFGLRGFAFVVCTLVLLVPYGALRALEAVFGGHRLTQPIVWLWARMGMLLAGLRLEVRGTPMAHGGAIVANHSTWLDIFVIRAAVPIYFVAKAEVRGWPGIGWLAAITRTLFIERKRAEARRQEGLFVERLEAGQRLCFFPEGTSSDGMRVLPFRSTLFSAFVSDAVAERMWVQPVTVMYREGGEVPVPFYAWWGGMDFGGHAAQVFARSYFGTATLVLHEPVRAAEFAGRKALAAHCEAAVRGPMDAAVAQRGLVPPPSREG